jgi:peptidoglycan hydrolase-like protein with peptidoglycan-binding domain
VVVTLAVVLAVGAGAAAATGFRVDTALRGGDRSGNTSTHLPPATAQVTRKTLVDTQTKSGELGYGDATSVTGRLMGTVTALPATGSTVARGQAVYHVDNAPIVLMYGALPAYRALSSETEGADVKQFKQNLYELGYRGFTVDEKYSDATVRAVKKWQRDLGLPQTGAVEQGRVVYAAGPVRVDNLTAAVGDPAGAAVLTYTGTSRVITVKLDVADQRLARKDAAVSIKLPDGKTASGKIANTLTVIQPASGQSQASTKIKVTVTIDDDKALGDLGQATVDVGFTASQRENVLTVPVAALLALAEGGYGVQVVEGTATRIVAVQTGMFAGGRVEVSGQGLTEGMTVGMPS